ncbi:MAG: hypothetical protein ABIU87_05530 [Ornithinibacter sp.]
MTRRTGGWVPVGLVTLAAIPVVAGTARLVEILGGRELIPADARFAASPAPVVVHVVAAIGYALLGAFQFSAGIRRRHPGCIVERGESWSHSVLESPSPLCG